MKIALTYDDGPNPAATPKLLDMLEKLGVKATFFMVGKWVEQCPELVKRVFDAGHTIGNHTFSHPKLTEIPLRDATAELVNCTAAIFNVIGTTPSYFRPPFILYNSEIEMEAKQLAMKTVLFDAAAGDGGEPKTYLEIFGKVAYELTDAEENLKSGIVLMHDGSHAVLGANRDSTIEATEHLIVRLEGGGAEFVSLEQFYAA